MSEAWNGLIDAAVALRHDLHMQPELTWSEKRTAEVIRGQLSAADIPWRECARYGTVATLAPEAAGRHIALRADIDALTRAAVAFGTLFLAMPDAVEFEINPLLAMPAGGGVIAVDALFVGEGAP